jgi:hypothetical protein
MADISGCGRDRTSDHANEPATTPSTCDTKLLRDNDKDAVGKGNDGELVETEQKLNSVMIDNVDDGVVSPCVKPDQKEMVDVEDLDSVVALGGLVESPGSDAEEHVPKTLFDPKDDRMDETNFAKPSAASDNDSLAMPLSPTSLPPSKTWRLTTTLLQQALEKKHKKNRKRNKTPTPNSNPTKARRTPLSS